MAFDFNGAAALNRHLDGLEFQEAQAAQRWNEIRAESMTCADDIHEVLFDVREALAESIAKNDAEAIGEVVLAAMGAYGARIATRVLASTREAEKLPSEKQAAAKALATLALRRAS